MKRIFIFMPVIFLFSSVSIFHPPSNDDTEWKARNKDVISIYEYGHIRSGAPCDVLRGLAFAESSGGRNTRHSDPMDRGWFGLHENRHLRAERIWRWGEYNPDDPTQAAVIAGHIIMRNYKYFMRVRKDCINQLHGEAMRELDSPMDQSISAYNQGIVGYHRTGLNAAYVDMVKRGANGR